MPIDGLPGEKLGMRIWETVEKSGIGLLSPWQIRRVGKARSEVRRLEMLMDEQTRIDIEALRAGTKVLHNGKLLSGPRADGERREPTLQMPDHNTANFIGMASQGAELRATEQLLNLRKSIVFAEEEAERIAEDPTSDKTIDPDWFSRWRTAAQDVSGEDLQRLWGRVLAGEAREPGSYSLRTLALLSTLSKDDAELIARAAGYQIDGMLVTGVARPAMALGTREFHRSLPAGVGPGFEDCLQLQEFGLVEGVGGSLAKHYKVDESRILRIKGNDKGLNFQFPGSGTLFSLDGYLLTAVGAQIITLGSFANNTDYLRAICGLVAAAIPGTRAWLGDRVRDPASGAELLLSQIEVTASTRS